MAFEIEIIEGHDPSSYFWFRPVIVHNTEKVTWKATEELKEEFSVEEGMLIVSSPTSFSSILTVNWYITRTALNLDISSVAALNGI